MFQVVEVELVIDYETVAEYLEGLAQRMLGVPTPMHSLFVDGQIRDVLNVFEDNSLTGLLTAVYELLNVALAVDVLINVGLHLGGQVVQVQVVPQTSTLNKSLHLVVLHHQPLLVLVLTLQLPRDPFLPHFGEQHKVDLVGLGVNRAHPDEPLAHSRPPEAVLRLDGL